ncbi:MAG: 2-amino-4-hydroxy-6-hydroxymethyldihydropteridine diphosphokinase [Pseudomonadota bacterium]
MLVPHRSLLLIALGSNQHWQNDGPEAVVLKAVRALGEKHFDVIAESRLFQSPSFPLGSGADYINGCVALTLRQGTAIVDVPEVLTVLHEIEARFGRKRGARWASRSLDLDLLAIDGLIMPDGAGYAYWRDLPLAEQKVQTPASLILPHPRMQDRAFVLVPLAEIAPNWCHPVSGLTVAQMLAALPQSDVDEIIPIGLATSL